VTDRRDGLYDYEGIILSTTADSDFVQLADQTAYYGFHIDPASATGACAYPGVSPLTWTAFKEALGTQMGSARIEWNDDGTLNYIVTTTGDLDQSDWTVYKGAEVTERTYVRRNQTDAEIDLFITGLDLVKTAGQQVEITRIKDDNEKMSVTVQITTTEARVLADVVVAGNRQTATTQYGWAVSQATAEALDNTYAALPKGTTGKIEISKRPDGTYDYSGVKISLAAASDHFMLLDQTVYVGSHINTSTGTPCSTESGGKSWTDFKALVAARSGNARIDHEEDGTVSYVATVSPALDQSDWTVYKGDNITERTIVLRNQTDAQVDTWISTNASLIAASAGRQVRLERIKDDNQKMSLTVQITNSAAVTLAAIDVVGSRESSITQMGWSVSKATAEAVEAGYSALPAGTRGKIDIKRNEDGSYDYVGIKTTLTGASTHVALTGRTYFVGHHVSKTAGTPCSTPAGNKSWADFKTYAAGFKGRFQIEENEDGTVSYTADLSSALNTELRVKVKESASVDKVVLLLSDMTEATLESYMKNTYMDDDSKDLLSMIEENPASGTNLLTNGSFEDWNVGNTIPTGWETTPHFDSAGARIDGIKGTYAARVTIASGPTAIREPSIAVVSGNVYGICGWVRSESQATFITVDIKDSAASSSQTITSAWKFLAILYPYPLASGTHHFDINVGGGTFPRVIDLDDWRIFRATNLREAVAGRTVKVGRVSKDKDAALFDAEIEIVYEGEQTLHDSDRTTSVPTTTVPRTGTALVSQWFEAGVNTDKLPEKPASIYDDAAGTWVEVYEMQQAPQVKPNGRFDWILNCRRTELPEAMLYPSDFEVEALRGKPKWVRHAKQRKTEKKRETVAQDSQHVMHLLNGLVDDPAKAQPIAWDNGWDAYVGDTAAPPSWNSTANGAWSKYIGKTYIDEPSVTDIAWHADFDEYLGLSENDSDEWSTIGMQPSWWRNRFIPSSVAYNSGEGVYKGGGTVSGIPLVYGVAGYDMDAANVGTFARPAGTRFYRSTKLPTHSGGTAMTVNSVLYSKLGEEEYNFVYIGQQSVFYYFILSSRVYPQSGSVLHPQSVDLSGATNRVGRNSVYGANRSIASAQIVSRGTRTAVAGYTRSTGTLLYAEGVIRGSPWTMTAGGYQVGALYVKEDVGGSGGYPYTRYSPMIGGMNFYIDRENLHPTDPAKYSLLPRFGLYKDKYSNPNLVEFVRKTRKKVDTEIYRKYIAIHPAMLASVDSLIPAGYGSDDGVWPSDGLWLDSNTLIKFNVSDNAVQMFGAMLYYAECTIEYYGEEVADTTEESARPGEGERNFPEVDEETGVSMIYHKPPEVSTLFSPNALLGGESRKAGTEYGETTKLIDYFEIRG